ncbi:MAG TPA: glycosyltransferase family 2 protein [Terracidiphilus sp.]
MNCRITASVVIYNSPEVQLTRLLASIQRSSLRLETYIIDNSPFPVDRPCHHLPGVTYIRAEKNSGYGAGHNVALRKAIESSDFHLVLNPDIYFEPHELGKMIRFIAIDPSIGQLMPKVIYPDGSLQYLCKLLPTPTDLMLRRFTVGPLRALGRLSMERFELRHSGYDRVMDVPCLSGCFMLFRISALRQIGLFDERFFMYMEDFDLTRRMHAQFRTVFYPDSIVVHDHAKESYRSGRALWVHIRNAIKYFNKWGWFYDPGRTRFNEETLRRINDFHSSAGDV